MLPKIDKFDSLEEFISYLENPNAVRIDRESDGNNEMWSGSKNFASAVEISRKGVDIERIQSELDKIPFTGNKDYLPEHNVSGAVVDVAAFLEGIPENMVDFPYQDDVHFVDVVVDIGELASVSAEVFKNKAIAAALLVNDLESHGYRAAVWVGNFQRQGYNLKGEGQRGPQGYGFYHHTLINVKRHREALSLGQLAGCLHPSFYRRMTFRHYEIMYGGHGLKVPYGYGQQISTKSELDWVKENAFDTEPILLPNSRLMTVYGVNFDLNKIEGAMEWAYYYASEHITKKQP